MTIRVLHWGTGDTGCMALHGIIGHPDLELVGLFVSRPDRAGTDAGDFVGLAKTGIIATHDFDAFLAIEADALSYFGPALDGVSDIVPFLKAGRNVVTTSYAQLILPAYTPSEMREPLEAACAQSGASVFATGAEPGMFSDLLPITLLSSVDELEGIRVSEIANYGRYAVEPVMRMWGFGVKPGDPIPLFESGMVRTLWDGVVQHLADELQVELDEITVRTDVALAPRDIPTACYVIEKGTVGAIRFEILGMKNGHEFIVLEHINFMHPDVCRHWPLGKDGEDTVYRVQIDGRPQMRCEVDLDYLAAGPIDSGLVSTAMRAVNAIPFMMTARPGVLGPLEVLPRPGRNPRPGGKPL
jgi:hypothetical protein